MVFRFYHPTGRFHGVHRMPQFKVPEDITLMVVDPNTGNKAKFSSKNTIIESYKSKNVSNGKVQFSNNNRLDTNNILKFY